MVQSSAGGQAARGARHICGDAEGVQCWGAGWERLLKELCFLENMTERAQQGGEAQGPAAGSVGGRWKLK